MKQTLGSAAVLGKKVFLIIFRLVYPRVQLEPFIPPESQLYLVSGSAVHGLSKVAPVHSVL